MKPDIRIISPYSYSGRLGLAYNREIAALKPDTPENDVWICLLDLDAMILTPRAKHEMARYIAAYPDTDVFTGYTNRVKELNQCYGGVISTDPNVTNHKRIALALYNQPGRTCKELTTPLSGVMMLFRKVLWKGFLFKETGILAVDSDWSSRVLKAGLKIRLMEQFYIFHYYRLLEGIDNTAHLSGGNP